MDRRRFLLTGSAVMLAGCVGSASDADTTSSSDSNSTSKPNTSDLETGERTPAAEEQPASPKRETTDPTLTLTARNQVLTEEASTTELGIVTEEVGNRLAFVEFTAQNTGDEPVDLPILDEIAMVVEGKQYPAHHRFAGELTKPISGPWYEGVEQARTGVETSGWLLFEVPGDTEMGRVSWSREVFRSVDTEYVAAEWDLNFGGASLPNFDIVAFDVPDRIDPYSVAEAEISVENTGAERGTFNAAITGDDINDPIEISETVPAGQTKTFSAWIPYPDKFVSTPFESTYRIGSRSSTVRYESPTLQEGEWFEHPTGYDIQVSNIKTAHQVEYEIIAGRGETETANQGMQYLLFELTTADSSGGDAGRVSPNQFEVVDNTAVESDSAFRSGETLVEPVSGDPYTAERHAPDEHLNGWVILQVPTGLSEDATIVFQNLDYNDLKPAWSF